MKKRLTLLATLATILILAALLSACNMHADNRGASIVMKETVTEQQPESEPELEQAFAEEPALTASKTEPDPLTMYREFLNGERSAQDGEYTYHIDDIYEYEDETYWNRYALFDMNGDGTPELHVRSVRDYYIFTCIENVFKVWCENSHYNWPLNNGALLFVSQSIGPKWISTNTNYRYQVFNFYGEELFSIAFGKCDMNGDEVYDDEGEDEYYFEDLFITKAQWDTLTAKYFAVTSDLITWYIYSEDGLVF